MFIPDYTAFKDLAQEVCRDNQWLVLDLTVRDDDWRQRVFRYKPIASAIDLHEPRDTKHRFAIIFGNGEQIDA